MGWVCGAEAIWLGMNRATLVQALGEPESQVGTKTRSILIYPDGARFELDSDRLIAVQGYHGRVELEPPLPPLVLHPTAAQPPAVVVSKEPVAPEKRPPVQPFSRQDGLTTYGEKAGVSPKLLAAVAGHVRGLYTLRVYGDGGKVESGGKLTLVIGVRLLLTLLVLHFFSRRFERESSWLESAWLAAADTTVRVGLAAAVYAIWAKHLPFYVSELVAAGVLFALLNSRPRIRDWWLALRIVAATKLAVFGFTFVLFVAMLDFAL